LEEFSSQHILESNEEADNFYEFEELESSKLVKNYQNISLSKQDKETWENEQATLFSQELSPEKFKGLKGNWK